MPSLIAKSPLAGTWPVSHGPLVLSEVVLSRVTSVAPFRGQGRAVEQALRPLGLGWPGPGRYLSGAGGLALWAGPDRMLLIGAGLETPAAAITDQTDGWALLRLEGAGADQVLARLVPVDLRPAHFPPGSVARSLLGHMNALILRQEAGFDIMVFRSMARSAWHELAEAMQHGAARQALP